MTEANRKTIIAGNWKMNKLRKEAQELAEAIVKGVGAEKNLPEILMCPPFTSLDIVAAAVKNSPIHCGAQNLDNHDSGAFTGEISAKMLIDVGCTHVII